MNICVTGSWDKTIKVWDGRTPQAQGTINVPERVYCMDTASPRVVVGCADKKVHVFDLRAPSAAAQSIEPLIKMQLRSLACFPNKTSFAVGSIEGRVAIHYFDQVHKLWKSSLLHRSSLLLLQQLPELQSFVGFFMIVNGICFSSQVQQSQNFAFKCHRAGANQNEIYAVNVIKSHPLGTFVTCGSGTDPTSVEILHFCWLPPSFFLRRISCSFFFFLCGGHIGFTL
jgi:WD40 repeat protein